MRAYQLPQVTTDPKRLRTIQALVNENFTSAEIAEQLGLSERTVKRCRAELDTVKAEAAHYADLDWQ